MENFTEKCLDLINQADTLMSLNNYDAALEKFLLAQKESPKYVECYIGLGNCYVCLEKFDDAVENFKKALMLDPKSTEILFGLGNVMYLRGDIAEAMKYYNKADETGGLDAYMCDVIAGLFVEEGDYVQALRYLNRAIKLSPLTGEFYISKARIFIEQQKAEEAINTLNELNQVLPDVFEAYDMLTQIYSIKGDFDGALKSIEKGVKRFPEDPNLLYIKLKLLVDFDKLEEATALVADIKTRGLDVERKTDFALVESQIYMKKEDSKKVVEILESTANGDYSDERLVFILSSIYYSLHKYDEVIKVNEQLLTNEVEDKKMRSSAKFYLAEAKLKRGDQGAEDEIRKLTKEFRKETILDPEFIEGYVYRLLLHKELKEYDQALALADYIVNLFPEKADGYAYKYAIYMEMNDIAKAEEAKAEGLKVDPGFKF